MYVCMCVLYVCIDRQDINLSLFRLRTYYPNNNIKIQKLLKFEYMHVCMYVCMYVCVLPLRLGQEWHPS